MRIVAAIFAIANIATCVFMVRLYLQFHLDPQLYAAGAAALMANLDLWAAAPKLN